MGCSSEAGRGVVASVACALRGRRVGIGSTRAAFCLPDGVLLNAVALEAILLLHGRSLLLPQGRHSALS